MPVFPGIPLSVLDLAPVMSGSSATQTLRNTLDLARRAEQRGYRRYWFAEHHNTHNIASSAPAVLIGQVASVTSTMRIGAGGVMLLNHPPLVVAEQFGTLEAFHPGRIDLGIGRAPGTDPATMRALRRNGQPSVDDFPQQLTELIEYFAPAAERSITAVPKPDSPPPIWLLGSSLSSAELAGALGLPYAFAHHIKGENTVPALETYRRSFRPSAHLDRPHTLISALVVLADTDEHAQWLATPLALTMLRLRESFRQDPFPSPEEAAAYPYTPAEREAVREYLTSRVFGGPETVRRKLSELVARTQADELMVVTIIHDHAERVRSYERLAEM